MEPTPETIVAARDVTPFVPNPADTLIAQAIDKSVDIATMEKLLAMRDKLMAEQARAAFFTALSAFQGECPVIEKSKTATVPTRSGGSFQYKYAPLDVIVRVVAPLLAKHALSFTVQTRNEQTPPAIVAICTVHHTAGHEESSEFRAPIDSEARMNVMQQAASALTYAKRYAFCNAFGILTGDEDDDGHGAGGPPKPRDTRPSRSMPPPTDTQSPACISQPQQRRLYIRARAAGHTDDATRAWLKAVWNVASSSEIRRGDYDRIVARLDTVTPLDDEILAATEPPPGATRSDDDRIEFPND